MSATPLLSSASMICFTAWWIRRIDRADADGAFSGITAFAPFRESGRQYPQREAGPGSLVIGAARNDARQIIGRVTGWVMVLHLPLASGTRFGIPCAS
jgi:hypothetical protein